MLAIETEVINLFSVYDDASGLLRTWIVEREGAAGLSKVGSYVA
jgi:hypothetical protein